MKVSTVFATNEDNLWESYTLSIDGKDVFRVGYSGYCPEDFTFSRDLREIFNLPALLRQAYKAGAHRDSGFILEETVREDND